MDSVPHDPDFDPPQSGIVNDISPTTIFIAGVILAILLLCSIGFFILLTVIW